MARELVAFHVLEEGESLVFEGASGSFGGGVVVQVGGLGIGLIRPLTFDDDLNKI